MNARALNALAGVICRAQESGKRTPMGIAIAVESAGLLMSPETAAELEKLRAELAEERVRVAELEAQRERRRIRLVALQNDSLNMRGTLSPAGRPRRVPMPLGETLTPVVEWLLARVAELEAAQAPAELTVYRASHESIVMGLYTTREAAREHCETLMHREQSVADLNWYPDTTEGDDEDAPEGLFMVVAGEESDTGYVVTPVPVASEYDAEADE